MSNEAAMQRRAESLWKRLERTGRRALIGLLGLFLRRRAGVLRLDNAPRILVLRLDERVGNLVMLTPLLQSLRQRFPGAQIEVLGNVRGQVLLGRHPDVDAFLPFRKRALFAADGPLRTPFFLRKQSYSVAIDASNPTDPSLTQAFFTATSGARYTIGSAARGCAPFFSHPVEPDSADIHEIEHRLNLLEPLPGDARVRMPSLAYDDRGVDADEPYVVINVGARVASKQLSVDEFVRLADVCSRSHPVVLTWGPGEHALAAAVAERCAGALVAPPTSLDELAVLLKDAYAVVSCDTGPMHLAVALGTPTLGIFLTTSPRRYGYTDVPHAVFDGRGGREGLTGTVCGWLARERVA